MIRSIKSAVVCLIVCLSGSGASAGIYSDDLAKCLVKSSSADDQLVLIQWIFAAMALHPAVLPYANISAEQRVAFDTKAGQLMGRLMTVDCRNEEIAALKFEGPSSIEASFSVLGEVAMRGIMTDPHVTKGMEGLDAHFDNAKLQELFRDAGLTKADKPADGTAK